jgi:hypothetical protein
LTARKVSERLYGLSHCPWTHRQLGLHQTRRGDPENKIGSVADHAYETWA